MSTADIRHNFCPTLIIYSSTHTSRPLTGALQTAIRDLRSLTAVSPFSPSRCCGAAAFFSCTFTPLSTRNNIEGSLPAYTSYASATGASAGQWESSLILNTLAPYSRTTPSRWAGLGHAVRLCGCPPVVWNYLQDHVSAGMMSLAANQKKANCRSLEEEDAVRSRAARKLNFKKRVYIVSSHFFRSLPIALIVWNTFYCFCDIRLIERTKAIHQLQSEDWKSKWAKINCCSVAKDPGKVNSSVVQPQDLNKPLFITVWGVTFPLSSGKKKKTKLRIFNFHDATAASSLKSCLLTLSWISLTFTHKRVQVSFEHLCLGCYKTNQIKWNPLLKPSYLTP